MKQNVKKINNPFQKHTNAHRLDVHKSAVTEFWFSLRLLETSMIEDNMNLEFKIHFVTEVEAH